MKYSNPIDYFSATFAPRNPSSARDGTARRVPWTRWTSAPTVCSRNCCSPAAGNIRSVIGSWRCACRSSIRRWSRRRWRRNSSTSNSCSSSSAPPFGCTRTRRMIRTTFRRQRMAESPPPLQPPTVRMPALSLKRSQRRSKTAIAFGLPTITIWIRILCHNKRRTIDAYRRPDGRARLFILFVKIKHINNVQV